MPDTWDSLTKEQRNEKVALEVMGYHRGTELANRHSWYDDQHQRVSQDYLYRPTDNIAQAWEVVEAVQCAQPGWRFCIVGGDGRWKADFFGHLNPHKNYGQRHGEAWDALPADAICHAAVLAVKGDDDGD